MTTYCTYCLHNSTNCIQNYQHTKRVTYIHTDSHREKKILDVSIVNNNFKSAFYLYFVYCYCPITDK